MLAVSHVTKTFFRNKKALDDVNIVFENGVYGLLGPNGSGKTTLMRCILGLYPYMGKVRLNGMDIRNNRQLSRKIGYLPQSFGLFRELSVYELMRFFAAQKCLPAECVDAEIKSALEAVHLSDSEKTKCKKLSGGMVRRVGIAQALLGKPEVILFDEPTVGLDPEERLRFKSIVSSIEQSTTVIISTHIVEDVESVCKNIAVFQNGKIIRADSVQEICAAAKGKVFDVPAQQSLEEGAFVVREYSKDGVPSRRVLSASSCGTPAFPTVEDGYLCLLKGI